MLSFLRRHIETRVLGMTGLALGGIDYENPPGDPGLFGPQAVCWRVHGDFSCMLVGGLSALMLQALHPLALAGVWDHSNFRQDMLGRLRRTGQFIAATTYGSQADAERLIARVRRIHAGVVGFAPDGRPYAASDPALLTWIHVAEVSSFLAAYLRYYDPALPGEAQDRYYDEVAQVAERLGARDVPRSRRAVADYLQARRPELLVDQRTREVVQVLLGARAPSLAARPVAGLMKLAAIDLLPDWARAHLALPMPAWKAQLARTGVAGVAPVLRWAVRNGSVHRARRRMGVGHSDA